MSARRLRRMLAAPLLLVAVAGCGGDDEPDVAAQPSVVADADEVAAPVAAAAAERPFTVITLTETFTDPSRTTDGRPGRSLETTIRYPDADGQPFPLIVFAHGFLDHPRQFAELTSAWAAAGYVVAAPAFPRTRMDAEAGPDHTDVVNQPADVSFVIDEVARLAEQEGHGLAGRVDLGRVGVAGHGLGVTTVLGTAFNSCCRDDRVDAVVALSGILLDLEGSYEFSPTPLMVLFGAADEFLPPTTGADLYERAQAPKALVTIIDGTHYPPYRDEPDPADETVVLATTRFWDHYVAGSTSLDNLLSPLDGLLFAAAVSGLTTLEHDLS